MSSLLCGMETDKTALCLRCCVCSEVLVREPQLGELCLGDLDKDSGTNSHPNGRLFVSAQRESELIVLNSLSGCLCVRGHLCACPQLSPCGGPYVLQVPQSGSSSEPAIGAERRPCPEILVIGKWTLTALFFKRGNNTCCTISHMLPQRETTTKTFS